MFSTQITFHDPGVSPALAVARQFVFLSQKFARLSNGTGVVKSNMMNTKLMPKEYVQVDHPKRPCLSGNYSSTSCEIACFEDAVAATAKCKYGRTINHAYNTAECNLCTL